MPSRLKQFFLKHWALVFIIAVWAIFASPYILQGKVPFPSTYQVTFFPPWSAAYGMPVKNNAMPDVITQIYPWKMLTTETWKQGQVPLWNPYSFAGTPHAANFQTAVFSPFNLLFFALPQVDAWSVLILLQPLLAGLFMFLFLGELVKNTTARLMGSIAFMFCGFLVVWMAYGTLGYAALFLPLILWGIARHVRTNSFAGALAASLGIALSFVSGHFQISVYVLLMSAAFLIFESLQSGKKKSMLTTGGFILLGLMLASPQLLLSYDAYLQSVRSEIFQAGEIIPWRYFATLLAPDFYGNPVTRNDWFGHYAEWASFVGVVPLLLAAFALVRERSKYVLFFAGAALTALLLAAPTPLVDLLFRAKIPVLSTSAASRIIILFSFSLSVLSSFGLVALLGEWKSATKKRLILFGAGVLAIVGVMWILLLGVKFLPADKLVVATRNFLLPTALTGAALFIFVLGHKKKAWIPHALCFILLLAASADSLRFSSKWMPKDPKELVFPKIAIIEALESQVGTARVVGNYGGELAVSSRVSSLEGYDALYPARYGELVQSANTGEVRRPERSVVKVDFHGVNVEKLLVLTGAKFILQRKSDGRFSWAYPVWEYPHYTKIYEDENYELYENGNALPRAFLTSSFVVKNDKNDIVRTLWSKDTELAQLVVLEDDPQITPQEGTGSATIMSYSPNRVVVQTESVVPKLLFVSDAYDPGWTAQVDGKSAPVYRADYAFRAVPVPAGAHEVVMVYAPRGWMWGRYLALTAAVILMVGFLKSSHEHRHL